MIKIEYKWYINLINSDIISLQSFQKTSVNYKMKEGEYMSNKIIEVQNIKVNVTNIDDTDYICISDFGKFKAGKSKADDVIRNWLRNRITL